MRHHNAQPLEPQVAQGEQGFSLLEIIMTMGLLLSLTIMASQLIKNSLEMRTSISTSINVNHRLTAAMERISEDLRHAYLVSRKRSEGYNPTRRSKPRFVLKSGDQSELGFTTLNHQRRLKNQPESDQTYVVYELKPGTDSPRTSLYRGEAKILPENLREVKADVLVAKDIKVFRVRAFDGVQFSENRWNSDSSSQRDMLPRMVEVTLTAWDHSEDDEDLDERQRDEFASTLETVIYLPLSSDMDTEKTPVSSFKWKDL